MVTLTILPSCKPKWSWDKFKIQSQILEGLGTTSWSNTMEHQNRAILSVESQILDPQRVYTRVHVHGAEKTKVALL